MNRMRIIFLVMFFLLCLPLPRVLAEASSGALSIPYGLFMVIYLALLVGLAVLPARRQGRWSEESIRMRTAWAAVQGFWSKYGRLANPLIRLAAFLIFALIIYFGEYQTAMQSGAFVATIPSVDAANAGYPFQVYYPNRAHLDTDDNAKGYFKFSESYGEYGIDILVAGVAVIGKAVGGDSFRVDYYTGYAVLLGLFLLTGLVFLLPNVPLPISLGGIAALLLAFLTDYVEFGYSRFWGATFTAIPTGILLASLFFLRRNLWTALYLVLMTLLLGFAPFLRQDALGIHYVLMAGLAGMSLLIGAAAYRVLPDKDQWRQSVLPLCLRVWAVIGVLAAAAFGAPLIMRGIYAAAWETPFAQTRLGEHGTGLPLYLGLGFAANPYNIGWDDYIGISHASLIIPNSKGLADPRFQDTLFEEWRSIVRARPWLVVENTLTKVERLNKNLAQPKPALIPLRPTQQTSLMTLIYAASFALLLTGVVEQLYSGRLETLLALTGGVALAMGASLSALLVTPDYIGGPQGASLVIFFLAPPAAGVLATRRRESDLPETLQKQVTRRALQYMLGITILVILLFSLFIGLQRLRYESDRKAVLARDPLAALQEMQFRYAHFFNDFSLQQQQQIVDRLKASGDPRIGQKSEVNIGDTHSFDPILVVLTDRQAHVIARQSAAVRDLLGETDFVGLTLCVIECQPSLSPEYNAFSNLALLSDLGWDNRYRMISFPIVPSVVQTAGEVTLTFQRFIVDQTGYVPEQIINSVDVAFSSPPEQPEALLVPPQAVVFSPKPQASANFDGERLFLASWLKGQTYPPGTPLPPDLYAWIRLVQQVVFESELDLDAAEQAALDRWRSTRDAAALKNAGVEFLFFDQNWAGYLSDSEWAAISASDDYELVKDWVFTGVNHFWLYRVKG